MHVQESALAGVRIIEHKQIVDDRGYFTRLFDQQLLVEQGIEFPIVQINQSLTKRKGTIRGMHFQKSPKAEDKIIRCIRGAVIDVALDVSPESPTFGQWIAVELTDKNSKMLLIPKGFAHGFQTLTDDVEMEYYMSEYYSPEHATGVRWDDPLFSIKWPIDDPFLSEKDRGWPNVHE